MDAAPQLWCRPLVNPRSGQRGYVAVPVGVGRRVETEFIVENADQIIEHFVLVVFRSTFEGFSMSTGVLEQPLSADSAREKLVAGLLIALVLCLGIAARVRVVQLARGLVRDDASLAFNIVPRTEMELFTKPLVDDQVAPIGYLLLTRELVRWFGPTDTVLRMPSFVASILTLLAYVILARQVLSPKGQVVGLAMMAFSYPLISYACRAKPVLERRARRGDSFERGVLGISPPPDPAAVRGDGNRGYPCDSVLAAGCLHSGGNRAGAGRSRGSRAPAQEVDRLVRRRWPLARRFRRDLPHVPSAGHQPRHDRLVRQTEGFRTVPAAIDC